MKKYTLKDEFGLIDFLMPLAIVIICLAYDKQIERVVYSSLIALLFIWGTTHKIIRYYHLTHYGTMLLQNDCIISHTKTKGEVEIIVKYQNKENIEEVKIYKKYSSCELLISQNNKVDMIIDLNNPKYFHIFI